MKYLICFLCVFYRMLFWKELNLLLSYFYLFKGINRYLFKKIERDLLSGQFKIKFYFIKYNNMIFWKFKVI